MKYKKTDLDIKKEITLETFKSYLKAHVKIVNKGKWNHLENIVDDLQEIIDSDSYGPFTKNVYDMKMIYETLLDKIKDETDFDNVMDNWKIYYLNKQKHNTSCLNGLNSKKVTAFINTTFKQKIEGYITHIND